MGQKKHLVRVAVLVVVASVAVYFLLSAVYQLPDIASVQADIIDNMFAVYFGLIAFFFTLIMVFMLYSAVVFRRRPGDETDGPHIHGHTGLEIAWTIIPLAIVIGLGFWGHATFNQLVSAQEGEMVVKVIGQQWSWSFEYPEYDGLVSTELVLPVDRPVKLEMEARDVIHSFWVPEFRVKQDLVPGRVTTLRIEPTETGDYKLRCAEICGLNHTSMLAGVTVVSQADFDSWVDENRVQLVLSQLTPEERGEFWYNGGDGSFSPCSGCHNLTGAAGFPGPTWLGIYGREEALEDGTTIIVDDDNIHNSIFNPNDQIVEGFLANVMPQDYQELFEAKQAEILADEGVEIDIIADLIAFMKTLEE